MAEKDFVMRQLSLTEIIDESVSMYRKNFGLLFGIALIPSAAAGLLTALITLQTEVQIQATTAEALTAAAVAMGLLVLVAIGAEVGNGAMTSAISERILGKAATIGSSYRRIGRRFGPFVALLLMKGLLIFVGLLFCGVPGIVISVMLFVSVCAFVIEGQGPKESLERSWHLVKGNGFRVFGLWLLVTIIGVAISWALGFLFNLVVSGSASAAATQTLAGEVGTMSPMIAIAKGAVDGFAAAIVAPLMAAAVTITYYDLRVRKEGFDLEMLAESLNRR